MPLIRNMRGHVAHIETKSKVAVVSADPTDNIFLECAIDGKADYVISGDRHLLELGNYENIPIILAREFLVREGFTKE